MVNFSEKGKTSNFPAISPNRTISARELHLFLEVKTHFKDWIKRMFEYGFIQGKDYDVLPAQKRATNNPRNPFTYEIDYALTMDTAKEICMIQRTSKGKEAREYFISVEKAYFEHMYPTVFKITDRAFPRINKFIVLEGYYTVKVSELFMCLGLNGNIKDLIWDMWTFAQNETKSFLPILQDDKIIDYWVTTWQAELYSRLQQSERGWAIAKYFREDESPKRERRQRIANTKNQISVTVTIDK